MILHRYYFRRDVVNSVKASVFLYRADDYINSVKENLQQIEEMNPEKIQFTFYDSKDDQGLQNQNIDISIINGTYILLVNLVDLSSGLQVISKAKENNLPIILFNREPKDLEAIRGYDKALYIGTDPKGAGILQGKILIDQWINNKEYIDRNRDDVMQYIMLIGEADNREAIERTKYSVETIKNAQINVEELARREANWDKELARSAIEALIFRYGNRIEVIISNDDSMAEGAIIALQIFGYNKGDKMFTIPVVGVNATKAARELISKGYMAGTVLQDAPAKAEALYLVAMNMAEGKAPLEGTNYAFDETGVAIRIPYREYIG